MAINFFLVEKVKCFGISFLVVRDDVFPFIGGGNKARKALAYEVEFLKNGYNALVTTGGIQSNHNRAMALLAAKHGWKCHLVYHGSKERFYAEKGNALFVRKCGVIVEFVEASGIAPAMDAAMESFRLQGLKPYYVTGGGHDIPGGLAYVEAAEQLYNYGIINHWKPEYIFHASGTGSTQAGIVVGLEKVGWGDVKVVGISVARQKARGQQVIIEFANELAKYCELKKNIDDKIFFNVDYLCGGYENYTPEMEEFLNEAMIQTGLIFDTTYSGKAFYGMMSYIQKNNLQNRNILFWHTGGLLNTQK